MEAVRGGIENSIRQLSGTAVSGNMASFRDGARYQMPARSADEIKADMAARRQMQPQQAQQLVQAMADDMGDQDDLFARLSRTVGADVPLLDHEEQQDAGTDAGDDSGPMPWVF